MPIDLEHIEECSGEVYRFVERLEKCLQELKTIGEYEWPDTRKTAALRRASMDLTRALARLRKS
jgi:hypothetical protein